MWQAEAATQPIAERAVARPLEYLRRHALAEGRQGAGHGSLRLGEAFGRNERREIAVELRVQRLRRFPALEPAEQGGDPTADVTTALRRGAPARGGGRRRVCAATRRGALMWCW